MQQEAMEGINQIKYENTRRTPMNTVSHNANQEDQQKESTDPISGHCLSKAEKRSLSKTPKNDQIDVFEFEPNGFMSQTRW